MRWLRGRDKSGQATIEFILLYLGVMVPLTFAIIFTAELLWVWNSVVEYTREGARYAATHCWQASPDNVTAYMQSHMPAMIDSNQFQTGQAEVQVLYYARDPDTGELSEFSCDSECSTGCIPDAVTVSVTNYEFRRFVTYLGLPPVSLPNFQTSVPMESAGCDPEQGTCIP
jgi:hypothetical protein